MKLFHTFTGVVLILLACNTKSEEKKSENWEHFVENTNENTSVETPKTNTVMKPIQSAIIAAAALIGSASAQTATTVPRG